MRFAAWKWVQRLIVLSVLGAGAGIVQAQTLTDIGAANPTPGPSDISQLSTNGNQRLTGSFNYYTDNINPPGQTFTAKSGPLALTSVSIRTGTLPPDSGGGATGAILQPTVPPRRPSANQAATTRLIINPVSHSAR